MNRDNKARMLLETNRRFSSTKKTRYFYMKNRIEKGDLSIKYCLTDNISSDFYTKPLQVSNLKKNRNLIMNIDQE